MRKLQAEIKIHCLIGIAICGALFVASCTRGHEVVFDQVKFERKPFQKSPYVIEQPDEKSQIELADGKTADIKAHVVEVDKKQGKYEFRWIGEDGKQKVISYQRHDAINAIVEGKVTGAQANTLMLTILKYCPIAPPIYSHLRY